MKASSLKSQMDKFYNAGKEGCIAKRYNPEEPVTTLYHILKWLP